MEEKDSQDITIKKSHLYLLAALMIAVIGIFISYNLIVKNAKPKNLAPQTSYTGFSSGSQNQIAKLQGAVEFNNAIGKKAPDFSLESLDGSMVKLSDYLGKTIVLFFSEGSMCYPSCWNQIEQLSSDGRFNSNDVVSFSIVVDSKNQWEKIISKVPKFSDAKLLFDTSKIVSNTNGVLSLPSSMHKGALPGHTYFVIDKNGFIQYTLDDPRMAIRNDKLSSQMSAIA